MYCARCIAPPCGFTLPSGSLFLCSKNDYFAMCTVCLFDFKLLKMKKIYLYGWIIYTMRSIKLMRLYFRPKNAAALNRGSGIILCFVF